MSPRDLFNHKHNPVVRADYRPDPYKIGEVTLHINLDDENTVVTNRMVVERNPKVADLGGPLVLNGEDIDLMQLRILENGQWRDLDRSEFMVDGKQLIILRPPVGKFELEVVNRTNPTENTALSGLYKSGDIIGSQNESQGFRRITYYLDRPDNLAKFTTTLEADKAKYPVLLSNGNGDYHTTKDLGNGRHQITWADPFPKPSYLFATIAGDLEMVEDTFTTMSGKEVRLVIAVPKGYGDKVEWAMESLKRAMKWDEDTYGREYDLDVLHLVGLEKFNMGAMENKGLIVFNIKDLCGSLETSTDDELLRIEEVVGHEYFHNWTGNRVTVRDWFEISLKESLTELRNEQFSADMNSAAIQRIDVIDYLRAAQFPEDASPNAHFVRPEIAAAFDNIYSATVYRKGARVLEMMKTILGDVMWRRAMDEYFNRFDGQAVVVDDFINTMQDVSGIDLTQFSRWYSQSGTPEISYEGKYDADAKTYTLTLRQHTPETADQPQSEKLPLHIPVAVGLIGQSGNDINLVPDVPGPQPSAYVPTRILNLKEAEQTFVFKNVNGPVVPSILRNFSAPVKVVTQQTDDELYFRMAHDSDAFNRYDAAQSLKIKTILGIMKSQAAGKAPVIDPAFINAYRAILDDAMDGDMAFTANMLQMPLAKVVWQETLPVDPVAVADAMQFLSKNLAATFKKELISIYLHTTAPTDEKMEVVPAQMGRRALHNTALRYLGKLKKPDVPSSAIAQAQYLVAPSMTEKMSALVTLASIPGKLSEKFLDAFYREYKGNTNVVDNWLGIQAGIQHGDVIARMKSLMEHEAFDITNPNKVRALFGAFMNNAPAFHNMDGSGYKLLADMVIRLNDVNPHTASGIITPLTQVTMFGSERRKLMVEQLKRIEAAAGLDPQVKEKVLKALNAAKKLDQKPAAAPKPTV